MNYLIVLNVIGWVITFEGAFLLVPTFTAMIYGEPEGIPFLLCAIASALGGFLITRIKPKSRHFYAREGYVICALTWLVISLIGAIPLLQCGAFHSYVDALFEIVSGFTTTGSSVIADLSHIPHCVLIWRSFSHWVGGMGVLVFIISVLPLFGGQDMQIMKAESPGPSVGKLVPNVRKTASYLYNIYIVITILQFIILLATNMDPFSAICITLGTAGTGGFGIVNSSCANYTFVQQVIVTIFMMLFGVNFNLYFYLSKGKYRDAFSIEEVRWYFGIYAAAVIFIVLNIANNGQTLTVNIKDAAFSVASVMTTTGYATADFDKWPMFSRCILVTVMFIGACAGSTGGGMKVSRIMIYLKSLKKELSCMIHQKSVKIIKMDGKAVDHKVLRNANVFLVSYVIIFFASFLLITLDNFDFETSFTSVVATLNNIGPGLGMVGPTGNFSAFSTRSKIVLIFDMLTGRLEIFPMLLLIYPKTWSRK